MDPELRMSRARSQLIQRHAFFGALAMRLKVAPRTDIETMATEGKHLWYNPHFVRKMDEAHVLSMTVHEVVHCALGHHTRRGGRDPLRWNVACDHADNGVLVKAGFELWPGAIYDPAFSKLSAEEIYRILERQEQEEAELLADAGSLEDGESYEQGDGGLDDQQEDGTSPGHSGGGEGSEEGEEPGGQDGEGSYEGGQTDSEGSGSAGEGEGDEEGASQGEGQDGGVSDESGEGTGGDAGNREPGRTRSVGGGGEVWDAAPEHDQAALEEAAAEWEVYTRQAANVERRRGEGRLPGWGEEIIDQLDRPRVDWRDVLRRFVDYGQTKDHTWTKPNRRYSPLGYWTPGTISDGINHVALLIDTSYSMDTNMLKEVGTEAQAALDDGAIDKITVVFADERVHKWVEYNKGDLIDFTCYGRGGTRFSPTFEWVDKNLDEVAVAIYFTDLDCTDFGPEPAYPVLWAVHGADPRWPKQAPFGECMIVQ